MALIVSARTRSDATGDRGAGPGPVYDEYREVLPSMAEETQPVSGQAGAEAGEAPDMVLVQGPNHAEGQGFKMDRKQAEQYVKDNPNSSIVGDVESPPPPGELDSGQPAGSGEGPTSGGEPAGEEPKPAQQAARPTASPPSKPTTSADKG